MYLNTVKIKIYFSEIKIMLLKNIDRSIFQIYSNSVKVNQGKMWKILFLFQVFSLELQIY